AHDQPLNTDELAITTADTQPLPAGLKAEMEKEKQPAFASAAMGASPMKTAASETSHEDDSLLDLGDFEPTASADSDDFVLELDGHDEPRYESNMTKLYDDDAPTHRRF